MKKSVFGPEEPTAAREEAGFSRSWAAAKRNEISTLVVQGTLVCSGVTLWCHYLMSAADL